MINLCKAAGIVVIMLCLGTSTLVAQTSAGAISGVVNDESGAVVPSAQVGVTDVDTGITRSVSTDASGRYRVPSLIPGHYEVQVQLTGFETAVRSGIELTVGQEAVINMVLRVGQVSQKTVVTAEAPIVETTTSTLSGLVDDKTIRDLPLNGRSFDQLISLESSAPRFYEKTAGTSAGNYASFTVNGARTQANLFLMDGTEMLSGGFLSLQPGGVLGENMGVDAIQEFKVLTGSYSAAYGKKAGGVVNIATRSGTNQIHGSALEFLRNSDLDARNFFDPGSGPPAFKRNQFGGALGGPIKKDRTFFFGNYEGLRQNLGQTLIAEVPDNNSRLQAIPAVQPFFVLFPAPNGRVFGDGTAQSINSAAQISRQDFFLVRVDHKLSDKDFIFGRYNFTQAHQTLPDTIPLTAGINSSRDQVLTLEEKRVYATMVNAVRFGYTRGFIFLNDLPTVPVTPSLFFFPGAETIGQIAFGGLGSFLGPLTSAGTGTNAGRGVAVNLFDGSDQLFLTRGPHSLQLGVQVERVQRNFDFPTNARGAFQFSGLQAFLQGVPTLFKAPSLTTANDPFKGYRQVYFSTFVQDDYKVFRNLTLNLGLRYEFMTSPTEVANRISNYYAEAVNGVPVLATAPRIGYPLFDSHWLSFAPRIGFAWDPFSDGKMSVRGGFGIFYDQSLDAEFENFTINNAPFYGLVQVNNPPFPLGFSGASGTAPKPSADTIQPHLGVPTVKSWNFGIQRQITANTVFNIGYVGSSSYHLSTRLDWNQAIPQFLPGGIEFFPPNLPSRNPALAGSKVIATAANASYNALQLAVTQRFSNDLRFKASYTYAKNIDDGSNINGAETAGTPDGPQNEDNVAAERGLSSFDVRNNLALNFTYDLPGRNSTRLAGKFLGGWQLGAIASIQSGTPFDIQTGFSNSRNQGNEILDRPNLQPGASNNPVLGGPTHYYNATAFALPAPGFYGNLGRDTAITPGFATADFILAKTFPVNERLRLDFRSEFFNLLNRANFGLPDPLIFNTNGSYRGSAGAITSTVSSSRQIQFGLKLSF